jgi:valyl-tRNA synthetase
VGENEKEERDIYDTFFSSRIFNLYYSNWRK